MMVFERIKLELTSRYNYWKLASSQAKMSELDSYEFVYKQSGMNTVLYKNQSALRKAAFMLRPESGLLMEFGVFKGNTINFFAKILEDQGDDRSLYGFDSFVGFSEVWSGVEKIFPSSRFDRKGKHPKVLPNVKLIDGFIENTLPEFIVGNQFSSVGFIHIDTDTFTPAYTVLKNLKPFLTKGAIIVFDELCGYPNWRSHEFHALESVFERGEYEFVGFSVGARRPNLMNAAIRLL